MKATSSVNVDLLTCEFEKTKKIFHKNFIYFRRGASDGEIGHQDFYYFYVREVLRKPYYEGSETWILSIVRLDTGGYELLSFTPEEINDDTIFEKDGIRTLEARKKLGIYEVNNGIVFLERKLREEKKNLSNAESEYKRVKNRISIISDLLTTIKK